MDLFMGDCIRSLTVHLVDAYSCGDRYMPLTELRVLQGSGKGFVGD